MKKLSTRETSILIVTLGLVLIFIIYQFVVKPMQGSAVNIDDQMRVNHAHLIKARKMVARKKEVEARYQHWVGIIGGAVSEGSQMTAMVSKIESAAREANIHVENIQPQKPVSQKTILFFPVELTIDGQWLDIVKFLYTLQQVPNYYFIDELNVEKYSDTVSSLRGRIVVSCMRLANP